MSFRKSSQFELFPTSPDTHNEDNQKRSFLMRSVTLSLETAIVSVIILMMGLIFCFSFGMQRGKSLAMRSVLEKKVAAPVETAAASTDSAGIPVAEQEAVLEAELVPASSPDQELLDLPKTKEQMLDNLCTIQVASFKLEKNARKEAEALEKKGYEIFVMNKGTHSIVCVGKFNEKDEAKKFAKKLGARYNDYLVRRF